MSNYLPTSDLLQFIKHLHQSPNPISQTELKNVLLKITTKLYDFSIKNKQTVSVQKNQMNCNDTKNNKLDQVIENMQMKMRQFEQRRKAWDCTMAEIFDQRKLQQNQHKVLIGKFNSLSEKNSEELAQIKQAWGARLREQIKDDINKCQQKVIKLEQKIQEIYKQIQKTNMIIKNLQKQKQIKGQQLHMSINCQELIIPNQNDMKCQYIDQVLSKQKLNSQISKTEQQQSMKDIKSEKINVIINNFQKLNVLQQQIEQNNSKFDRFQTKILKIGEKLQIVQNKVSNILQELNNKQKTSNILTGSTTQVSKINAKQIRQQTIQNNQQKQQRKQQPQYPRGWNHPPVNNFNNQPYFGNNAPYQPYFGSGMAMNNNNIYGQPYFPNNDYNRNFNKNYPQNNQYYNQSQGSSNQVKNDKKPHRYNLQDNNWLLTNIDYASKFQVQNNIITLIDTSQVCSYNIFGKELLKNKNVFSVTVLQSQTNFIDIGIAELSYYNNKDIWGQNSFVFMRGYKGEVYKGPGEIVKSIGMPFKKGDQITVIVNFDENKIIWKINGKFATQYRSNQINSGIDWVPILRFINSFDSVKWNYQQQFEKYDTVN